MTAKPKGALWSDQDTDYLIAWAGKRSVTQLAIDVGRGYEAVLSKLKRMRMEGLLSKQTRSVSRGYQGPLPDKTTYTERACLRCTRPFMSWGKGNRLCADCRLRGD